MYTNPIALLTDIETVLLAARRQMEGMDALSLAYDSAKQFYVLWDKQKECLVCLPVEPSGYPNTWPITWPAHEYQLAIVTREEVRHGFSVRGWQSLLHRVVTRMREHGLIDGRWPAKEKKGTL